MPLPAPSALSGKWQVAAIWRWLGLLALTSVILLWLACLLALRVPVTFITRNIALPPAVEALHGSARAGRAVLQGGTVLLWESGFHLLPLPHLRSDLTLEGPGTRLTGWAAAGLSGLQLNDIDGRAGPPLAQLVPGAWACDMTARVSRVAFSWGWRSAGSSGEVSLPSGTCTRGTRETTLPPLTLALGTQGRTAVARLSAPEEVELAQATVSRDRQIGVTIKPAAADVFPVLPRGGPISVEIPF